MTKLNTQKSGVVYISAKQESDPILKSLNKGVKDPIRVGIYTSQSASAVHEKKSGPSQTLRWIIGSVSNTQAARPLKPTSTSFAPVPNLLVYILKTHKFFFCFSVCEYTHKY